MTDYNVHSTGHIDGVEVRPGVTWRRPLRSLQLSTVVECVSVQPKRFVGGVELASRRLVTTEPLPDKQQAERQAEAALLERVAQLLSSSA